MKHLTHLTLFDISEVTQLSEMAVIRGIFFLFNQDRHSMSSFSYHSSGHGCSTPIDIALKLDASPGCGGIAWPAGEVLANYLTLRGEECCTGRTILELGSGTGLVGLVAGKLGGQVWITDQALLLDMMQVNVKLNQLESSVIVSELNWGEALPQEIPRPDLILAADLRLL
ncbi:putative methyltransferase-domain-containing protein [Chiua virens]|nr:putative methyltransferase-domain-containing protein [Chiua virens]